MAKEKWKRKAVHNVNDFLIENGSARPFCRFEIWFVQIY